MISLVFPFGYAFNTRAKSSVHKLSFLAFIVIPPLLSVALMTDFTFGPLIYFAAFTGMFMVYEIGYIFNDIYTTQWEAEPTEWLKSELLPTVKKTYPLLISVRCIYIAIAVILLYRCQIYNFNLYILSLGLLSFSFSLHNYFRGPQNVFTDFAVNFFKYSMPLLPFAEGRVLIAHIFFINIEISLIRALRYGIGKEYMLSSLKKYNVDTLRIIYYSVLIIAAALLMQFSDIFKSLFFVSLYLLIYRILCKLLMKSNMVAKSRRMNEGSEE